VETNVETAVSNVDGYGEEKRDVNSEDNFSSQ
jgi:hypothetical protein